VAISPQQQLEPAIQNLADKGLNLFAILAYTTLPESARQTLTHFDFPLTTDTRIILIGHGGTSLWSHLQIEKQTHSDPIDHYSETAAREFADHALTGFHYQIVYPGAAPVALQQLGTLAGWHTDSPLGLGINPQWGLWYAYRAALLTNAPLSIRVNTQPDSPCKTCSDPPCLSHCPANALTKERPVDINRCARYRLSAQSDCSDQCLSRNSCPVSTEHRYTLDQIQYHYRHSLQTLRNYYNKQ